MKAHQEALPLTLADQGSFKTFVAPHEEATALAALRQAVLSRQNEFYLIVGPQGSGKSHLLSALQKEMPAAFSIDLKLAKQFSPEFIAGDIADVTLIDNADAVAGDESWELALFALFNRWYDARRGTLIMASTPSFDKIPFLRHDLNTRLGSGITLQLDPLNEDECVKALTLRAQNRGFTLPEASAAFMVRHGNRDMNCLIGMLNRLDSAQLEQKHALTVPFVKQVLGI